MPSSLLLHGSKCLKHLCPAHLQLGDCSYCCFWPDLGGAGERLNCGVGTEDGKSEHLSTGPISYRLCRSLVWAELQQQL